MDIIALRRQGFSIRKTAKKLGIHRKTVKRHLESNSFPQYGKKKQTPSILDPFRQIIDDFLEECGGPQKLDNGLSSESLSKRR